MNHSGLCRARSVLSLALAIIMWPAVITRAQNIPPNLPNLVAPAHQSQATDNPPTFTAVVDTDADGDSQQVQFGVYMDDTIWVTGSDFLSPSAIGDTLSWTPADTLHENWFYFWTARATDGIDTTPQFGYLNFFLLNAVNEDPSAAGLIGPVNDSLVFNAQPTFHWTPAVDPDYYDTILYQLWSTFAPGDCVIALFAEKVTDTFYRDSQVLPTMSYFWGVVADDGHGGVAPDGVGLFRIYLPGDVNLSGMVTSADVIVIINYLFRGGSLATPDCAADFNLDGSITTSDVISFVNHVFKGFRGPTPACDL